VAPRLDAGEPLAERLLVTGGAGFIGANLIDDLVRAGGYEIRVVDNESTSRLERIPAHGVNAIRADIRDLEVVGRALDGVDTVVHLAADTRVMDSIADPAKNFDVNVAGSFHLLRLARDAGVKCFVNASTGGAILGDAPSPVHEEMPARPLSPYGASKLAVEGYCSAFAGAYGMKSASLRFSNVYGPRSFHKGSVVAHYFKLLLKGDELVVFGDGSQVRDFLFVGDLVHGIRAAIQSGVSGVFQLGSGRPTSVNELIEAIDRTVAGEAEVRVRYAPSRRGEVHTTWCDISKARTTFGFEPATSLEDGLRTTWTWFRDVWSRTASD
jgi:UDP-glucose 4-epimerase